MSQGAAGGHVVSSEGVTAVILAGGAGTRLRSVVSDRPKVLADVNGRPFLAYLLDQLQAAGIALTVISTGYLAEQVHAAVGDCWGRMAVEYSREATPLGTGGALRLAATRATSGVILALNGDSYCDVDLSAVHTDYKIHGGRPLIVLSHQDDTSRFGRVDCARDGSIVGFHEKQDGAGRGWINAGIYMIDRARLLDLPHDRPVSIEREAFPAWVPDLRGFPCFGAFLDVGTPESYSRAAAFFARLPANVK
ncbi:MAG: nucleotidyltransferase family protein [Pirellulales bacterium]